MPAGVSVKTGEQAAADATAETADAIGSFLTPVLLAFAGVSVFVGAFIIFNAFSITVAQRRREFAMLRALGASRRQVLTSQWSPRRSRSACWHRPIGIAAGLGVAKGVNALFKAVGANIATAGMALEPAGPSSSPCSSVWASRCSQRWPRPCAVRACRRGGPSGGLGPARRRARPGPARRRPGRHSPRRQLARLRHLRRRRDQRAPALHGPRGAAALRRHRHAPRARRPASEPVVGWPIERLAPTSGRLARDNAGRNPSRTAATATTLMIGLGRVVFVAVFAQAMKGSFGDAISECTRADLVAQNQSASSPCPRSGARPRAGARRRVRRRRRVRGPQGQGGGVLPPTPWSPPCGPRSGPRVAQQRGSMICSPSLSAGGVILEGGWPWPQGRGQRHDLRHRPIGERPSSRCSASAAARSPTPA